MEIVDWVGALVGVGLLELLVGMTAFVGVGVGVKESVGVGVGVCAGVGVGVSAAEFIETVTSFDEVL